MAEKTLILFVISAEQKDDVYQSNARARAYGKLLKMRVVECQNTSTAPGVVFCPSVKLPDGKLVAGKGCLNGLESMIAQQLGVDGIQAQDEIDKKLPDRHLDSGDLIQNQTQKHSSQVRLE